MRFETDGLSTAVVWGAVCVGRGEEKRIFAGYDARPCACVGPSGEVESLKK